MDHPGRPPRQPRLEPVGREGGGLAVGDGPVELRRRVRHDRGDHRVDGDAARGGDLGDRAALGELDPDVARAGAETRSASKAALSAKTLTLDPRGMYTMVGFPATTRESLTWLDRYLGLVPAPRVP